MTVPLINVVGQDYTRGIIRAYWQAKQSADAKGAWIPESAPPLPLHTYYLYQLIEPHKSSCPRDTHPDETLRAWYVCQIIPYNHLLYDRWCHALTWAEKVIAVFPAEEAALSELMKLVRRQLLRQGKKKQLERKGEPISKRKRYWRTPPELFASLDREFHFTYDPCPCPVPTGYDGLQAEWGEVNYVNPPFRAADGIGGAGPTAFARKAVEQHKGGKTSVLILPVQSYVNMLLQAGAEIRPIGRVVWLEVDSLEPCPNGTSVACFVLRGRATKRKRGCQ